MFPALNKKKRATQQQAIDRVQRERFRDIQTTIAFQMKHKKNNIIIITSANQGEGKSYCALRIAKACAEKQEKTLLIDLDLHRPRLSKDLANGFPGITSLYEEERTVKACTVDISENLTFLPSGPTSINTTNIIDSQKIKAMIYSLAEEYDRVIIDTPPILPVVDTKLIAAEFKNIVLVVGAKKTKVQEIQEAMKTLSMVNPSIIGTVLNMESLSKNEIQSYYYN
ncbi:CpsD/CapB family tyrosine-protein kinase [Bacillus wiedmannii]|uniref:CpsD/CapB family tyrosine-protein kinase n=1 Tax=Bacillus wiedmannii TaxID=1890302 RepID=UPI000BF182C7|nr:CpsD/CapB family tyrosine-protein kinase [Bacillus wiedmannii]PEO38854.1 capsular biosynthesis protein [Bacillus wiedmannii]